MIDIVTASMPKCQVTDSEGKIVDGRLQLSGGYGYMHNLAPHWVSQVLRTYAGMKLVVARGL